MQEPCSHNLGDLDWLIVDKLLSFTFTDCGDASSSIGGPHIKLVFRHSGLDCSYSRISEILVQREGFNYVQ